ncbi:hypothetical protein [Sphingobacterium deserti]|uniref:Uncharacterized protein n=1 Tax=Sphingobacterium deserti TaxID=1229276 RepID=A0A0B8T543_9SPHI|nr:hypothetical protein [Sphingobacterium deserti]KGE12539.1 hypothetical protein DI53_3579 [Sphingobacterium deserti]
MTNYHFSTDIKTNPLSLLGVETFALDLLSTVSNLSGDYDGTSAPPNREREAPDMDPEIPDKPEIDEIEENEPMEQPDIDPLERPEPDIDEIEHDEAEPEINNRRVGNSN